MELKQYWKILKRRLWIVILITLVTGVASFLVSPEAQVNYVASTRLILSVPPEEPNGEFFRYNKYYAWVASEYLVDDFGELIRSQAFLEDVKAELEDPTVDINNLKAATRSERTHRILTLTTTSKNREQALRVANAAVQVIQKKSKYYLAQLEEEGARVRVIDPPTVVRESTQLRSSLNIGLRTILGFLAGLALVFFLHYLDSALYGVREVEQLLGVSVLGEIPPES